MAWNSITETDWEYSDTPEVDGNYIGNHVLGIRTNSDTTEIYVYCRQITSANTPKVPGGGFGEINKTALEG